MYIQYGCLYREEVEKAASSVSILEVGLWFGLANRVVSCFKNSRARCVMVGACKATYL